MKVLKKVLFIPAYFTSLILNLMAWIAKGVVSLAGGILLLFLTGCMIITLVNHAWIQALFLFSLLILGYVLLVGVVFVKVLIEEFKNFCLRNLPLGTMTREKMLR